MKPTVLLTRKATRAAMLAALRAAAKTLASGDFFFLTYSGHGGQVPDVNGDEDDKKDETWCLYDGQLIDDELYFELGQFKAGVRILVLSDSCHSGTVTRAAIMPPTDRSRRSGRRTDARRGGDAHLPRAPGVLRQAADRRRRRRPASRSSTPTTRSRRSRRSGRLVGRSRSSFDRVGDADLRLPGQPDLDGRRAQRRLHRAAARRSGTRARFSGNYANLHARIRARLPASQSPNLFTLGTAGSVPGPDAVHGLIRQHPRVVATRVAPRSGAWPAPTQRHHLRHSRPERSRCRPRTRGDRRGSVKAVGAGRHAARRRRAGARHGAAGRGRRRAADRQRADAGAAPGRCARPDAGAERAERRAARRGARRGRGARSSCRRSSAGPGSRPRRRAAPRAAGSARRCSAASRSSPAWSRTRPPRWPRRR